VFNGSTNVAGSLVDALARLEQDITDAEAAVVESQRRLDHLRQMRAGIEPFIEQYVAPSGIASGESFGTPTVSTRPSLTDRVVEVFGGDHTLVLDVNEIIERLRAAGVDDRVASIRNAVYYAARSDKHNLQQKGGGRFALVDLSAPVAAGAEAEGVT
jgi:hypothetical protein